MLNQANIGHIIFWYELPLYQLFYPYIYYVQSPPLVKEGDVRGRLKTEGLDKKMRANI